MVEINLPLSNLPMDFVACIFQCSVVVAFVVCWFFVVATSIQAVIGITYSRCQSDLGFVV